MDAEDYVKLVVIPVVEDLEKNPNSIRHALVASIMLYHTIDYIRYGRGSNSTKSLRRFRVIQDIANLTKHAFLDPARTKNKGRILVQLSDVAVGDSSAFSDGSYFSDGTTWADANGTVRVDYPFDRGNEVVDLTSLITHLLAELKVDLGII